MGRVRDVVALRTTNRATTAAPASGAAKPAPTTSKARLLERGWIGAVVGYSAIRFVAAWGALGEHGVNPWIFGVVDVGTAYPYARSIAEVAKRSSQRAWSTLAGPVVLAVSTFLAPYAYLWAAARSAPPGLKLGLVILVVVLAIAAVVGVVSQTRKLRTA